MKLNYDLTKHKDKKLYKKYSTLTDKLAELKPEDAYGRIDISDLLITVGFVKWGGLNQFSITQYLIREKKVLFFKRKIIGLKVKWSHKVDERDLEIERKWHFNVNETAQETMYEVIMIGIKEELDL
ncbi:hypothetical protein LQ318_07080 [Aliifodinibius salicampi]|uniref:Uncharacterized protein n=1 Tax=Fodinibius salicampi TaxID=1920655 RepID=A0ABT3PXV3_9BACT|nr:hypothetical protein [Fodinibius salicampi]MCW9712663.1 hypothetical protein [Fodinibius salicampi]